MPKTFKIVPKWQKFAQYGHTLLPKGLALVDFNWSWFSRASDVTQDLFDVLIVRRYVTYCLLFQRDFCWRRKHEKWKILFASFDFNEKRLLLWRASKLWQENCKTKVRWPQCDQIVLFFKEPLEKFVYKTFATPLGCSEKC